MHFGFKILIHNLFSFRAQIAAYRNLARNQPITQQVALMAAGKRTGDTPPECPTPPAQPPSPYSQGYVCIDIVLHNY